jgi:hypothetical protein
MITVDTSTITLDELEEKVLTMGQHVDRVLLRDSQSSAFVFDAPENDINVKLDKVNKQLAKLSAALMLSTFGSSNESESRGGGRSSDGRGGGRGGGGRYKRKNYCWNCGGDHHVIHCTRTILKEKEKGDQTDTYDDESAFISEVHFSGLHTSRFTSSPKDVYFPCGEFESNDTDVTVMHHVAFASTVSNNLLENSNVCDNDYSFLRIGRDDFIADVEPIDPVGLMAQVYSDYGQ